jgi:hypothetical protein
MKQITQTAIGALAAVLVLTGSVAARSPVTAKAPVAASAPIPLTSQPGTFADRAARRLMARELWESRRAGDNPLVLVATAHLAKSDVLFVQIQSTGDCGSAGCSTVSFRKTNGRWVRILDTVGGTIRVAESRHQGMPDLIIKDSNKLIWNGARYV